MVSHFLFTDIQHTSGYKGFSQDLIIPIFQGEKFGFKNIQKTVQGAYLELRQEYGFLRFHIGFIYFFYSTLVLNLINSR